MRSCLNSAHYGVKSRMQLPFQRPGWLLPWWRQFGQSDLRAGTITEDDQLIGFLPFYIYQDTGTNERQRLLVGAGTTDYRIFRRACGIGCKPKLPGFSRKT